jgi:hypothetical protein
MMAGSSNTTFNTAHNNEFRKTSSICLTKKQENDSNYRNPIKVDFMHCVD